MTNIKQRRRSLANSLALRGPETSNQTQFTRTGARDMTNRKPYRTAAQKAEAKKNARLVGGTYVSNAPVSFSRQKRVAV